MKGVISIFLLPAEFEDFAGTLCALKRNSVHVTGQVRFKVDITLCLSGLLTDWQASTLPATYIADRVSELCSVYLDWCAYSLYIEQGSEILGCASHRRKSLATNQDADFFIWLDADIFIKDSTLATMTNAYLARLNEGHKIFIITPQTVRLWNTGWDALVNEHFINKPLGYQQDADIFADVLLTTGTLEVKEVVPPKFGGGFFPLLTTPLLNMIGVPAGIRHYGHEDTFIVYCCSILQANGYNVKQFVVEGLLAGELYKHKSSRTILQHLKTISRKDEFKYKAELNFDKELQLFKDRYQFS